MEYRQLGNTGVFVSELSLGTMTFGGSASPFWGPLGGLGFEDADRIIGHALDAGVNLIDTADAYGDGETEEIVGSSLGSRRADVLLTSKVAMRVGAGPNDAGLSRVHIMRSLENTLRRLRTDYIDLYQIHTYDPLTSLEETLAALEDAVRQGKVRYLGASNITAWQTMKALGVCERRGFSRFAALESYYSLCGRDIETEILPMTRDQNMGHLIYSPLAGGLLTGKFDRDGSSDSTARRTRGQMPPADLDLAYDIIDCLRVVAARHETGVASVAVAWVLAQAGVTSVVLGAKRLDQLTESLNAVDVRLSAQDLRELDAASRPAVPAYPLYMQDLFMESMRLPLKS